MHDEAQVGAVAMYQAIIVAVLGLVVNGVSAVVLRGRHSHHQGGGSHHHDHNLLAAYLHVLADALTSVLAIAALLAAKYIGLTWMDPLMGVVGGILVARWSWGLLQKTSMVLVDRQAPESVVDKVRRAIVDDSIRILDLHVWEIGPGYRAAIVAVESDRPLTPREVKDLIPDELGIAHATVEVHHRNGRSDEAGSERTP